MQDFTTIDRRLDAWLDSHETEMVEVTQNLIAIPSVKGEPAPGAPYGKETREALDYVVQIGEKYGFSSKMLDGHAAHVDFGSGAELIGVLSHVDVVPAASDWKHNPWRNELEDGKIYGRGAIDDKGPTIAALYALIGIKELNLPVTIRLRHILGADEESGFGCMKHYFYVAQEEMPTLGFTPDGRFPAIYAEKGIANPTLTATVPQKVGDGNLIAFQAGERSNMVPNRASITFSFDEHDSLAHKIVGKLHGIDNVQADFNNNLLIITATGIGAHASLPHEGVNAVGVLCDALIKGEQFPYVEALLETLRAYAVDNTGACLGIAGSDEPSGPLTSNLGVLTMTGDQISATFSIRYPVTWLETDVKSKLQTSAKTHGFEITAWEHQGPLHVPKDSAFLTTLLDVYRSETGDMQEPQSMGGGTYARVLKQGVAFGPNFPGFPDNAHQADEYWTVSDLMKASKIYAKALIRLAI